MKAYLALSFSNRTKLTTEIETISAVLLAHKITPWFFVDKYQFSNTQEKEMMQQALHDIDACDFLLAETSYKGIGIGLEAGYAKAKNKPIVYLRNKNTSHSTTVAGISDYQIIYTDAADLKHQLELVLNKLKPNYDL
ncbi:nucleoside 2-deoxyribosyltransferase [Flavobacterium agricola]|uniref:Nucleoside 2-deoxyribosyltransferase n=1 Tax=Flavobacterium agricola TaxID=2870839 RepID=A0ABY6M1Z0_9FLAO|nr:nucleoside 2-deoxyribosyltransferase [Flavobacterium agricola]UYW02267.1 nucleoside 2-deoxyribosyltransferase [Flavobacterium agricola]